MVYFGGGHYRQPLAFSESVLEDAARGAERVRNFCLRLDADGPEPEGIDPYVERFFDQLAEDFNTPAAQATLFEWIAEGNRRLDSGERMGPGCLREMLYALGLERMLEPLQGPDERAKTLLEQREQARSERDYETADRKREELVELGWEVRDTAQGPQLVPRT
jgi:cysteinyl-tRNA synthetase